MEPSSSCDGTEIKHDVFISFRGPEIRRGLLSHLKKEFCRRQVEVYLDENLTRGDEISSALFEGIKNSQFLLVVFSEDYASSKWCLEELAKMIECMETNNRVFLPVFFNVDPSHVQNQHEEYGVALAKHEKTLKGNMLQVQNWRSALTKAVNLSGFHHPKNYMDESHLVDVIVEDILKKRRKFGQSESNGLVGSNHIIEQIQLLLVKEPSKVRFVGLWGMGGIGKTTIARAIFDKYSLQYDGCCFLNVREQWDRQGWNTLRERLICELMEEQGLHLNVANTIAKRLSRKKVFIVLDDVNTPEQLQKLVHEGIKLGPGSRVIITSRDEHVLESGEVHPIYEVKKMDPPHSLKLFCLYAFNECLPKMGYEELSREVVKTAHGNPLALKVLGSYFHSTSNPETWRCALNKIKKIPHDGIQSVLRFSYDGLHELEKKAFLDISFFFIEEDKDYVIMQLDSWGFHGRSGTEVLRQKTLITISNDNRIQMHDLIRDMGLEIVRLESPEYPERRSRLWDKDNVSHVLRNKLGTDKVEVMQIDVSQLEDLLPLNVDTFRKMPRLRFLKFKYPLDVEIDTWQSNFIELLQNLMDSKGRNLNKATLSSRVRALWVTLSSGVRALWGNKHSTRKDENEPTLYSEKQVGLLIFGCEELKNVASEVHIKCVNCVVTDGCSGPELPPGIEILNSYIGHLSNIEGSDVHDQPFKDTRTDLYYLRCTDYLKVSKSIDGEQDTKKPTKLHILFDGFKVYKGIIIKCNN